VKFTEYKIFAYTLPLLQPFGKREGLILEINNAQGGKSWGEIAPLPGRSRETLKEALEQLTAALKGETLPALFPSVQFGLQSALSWHTPQQPIPVCALLAGTPDEIRNQAEQAKRSGYKTAKVKLAHLPIAVARQLILELQSQFHLRIDLNRALSFDKTTELFSEIEPSYAYIEEPTREIQRLGQFPFPFALDESLLELSEIPATSHLKALVIKPSLIALPATKSSIVLSSSFETGIGILGIMHLAAELGLQDTAHGLDTHRFLEHDLLIEPLQFKDGCVHAPKKVALNYNLLHEVAHA